MSVVRSGPYPFVQHALLNAVCSVKRAGFPVGGLRSELGGKDE